MKPRLTEFSYGFCLTNEFVNRRGVRPPPVAPFFPSLYWEGLPGGGYDVRIGSAFFLQFKLCEELKKATAREARRGLLDPPFFRFSLHRRDLSQQHQLLVDLESVQRNRVYYVAPAFSDVGSLDAAFAARQVIDRSAFFSPADIGPLPDDSEHRISFRPGDQHGWFMSEPKRVNLYSGEQVLNRAHEALATDDAPTASDWLRRLYDDMVEVLREHRVNVQFGELGSEATFDWPDGTPAELLRIRYLATVWFGCHFTVGLR